MEKNKKGRVRKPASLKRKPKKNLKSKSNTSMVGRISGDGVPKRRPSTEYPSLSSKLFKQGPNLRLKNDQLIRSVSDDIVGSAKAFRKADRLVPDYDYDTMNDSIDSWMKHGGSIKKKMKKRPCLKGRRKELRGS